VAGRYKAKCEPIYILPRIVVVVSRIEIAPRSEDLCLIKVDPYVSCDGKLRAAEREATFAPNVSRKLAGVTTRVSVLFHLKHGASILLNRIIMGDFQPIIVLLFLAATWSSSVTSLRVSPQGIYNDIIVEISDKVPRQKCQRALDNLEVRKSLFSHTFYNPCHNLPLICRRCRSRRNHKT
jgi:hypothetical protein